MKNVTIGIGIIRANIIWVTLEAIGSLDRATRETCQQIVGAIIALPLQLIVGGTRRTRIRKSDTVRTASGRIRENIVTSKVLVGFIRTGKHVCSTLVAILLR